MTQVHASIKDYHEPLQRFGEIWKHVHEHPSFEPDHAILGTVDAARRPSQRVVLIRQFDERGWVFYTNQTSAKGQHIQGNANVHLLFYWPHIKKQVRVTGLAAAVDSQEADAYFATRPRESQIGAWASLQSQPLDTREIFEKRIGEYTQKYSDQDVPRPPKWSGYRITPHEIEFWEDGAFRLHHREQYRLSLNGQHWHWTLLYP